MSEINVNFDEAERFLDALAGYPEASFCFQTFDDSTQKREGLAAVRYGVFSKHCFELAELNGRGAGIFVTVNATDGRGRKAKNVIGLRALFVDGDDQDRPAAWHLAPSAVIRRGDPEERRWHAYWFLRQESGVRDQESGVRRQLELFGAAQKALRARYGTDHRIFDLPRVMRVPGFAHRKAADRAVVIEEGCRRDVAGGGPRYSLEEVLQALAIKEDFATDDVVANVLARGEADYARVLAELGEARRAKREGKGEANTVTSTVPSPRSGVPLSALSPTGEGNGGAGALNSLPAAGRGEDGGGVGARGAKRGSAAPICSMEPRYAQPEQVAKRVRGFLNGCDAAIAGQGGSNRALAVASALVNGFLLSVPDAVAFMSESWNARCSPPWSEKELIHKCESAAKKSKGPGGQEPGWLLNEGGDYAPRVNRMHAPATVSPSGKRFDAKDVEVAEEGEKKSNDAPPTSDDGARPAPGDVSPAKKNEISQDDAEKWIAKQFDKKFQRVLSASGLKRDKRMSKLFIELSRYLFAASPITADRIRNEVCDKKNGLGLSKRAYDQTLRQARAETHVEHGDDADWLRFARVFLNEEFERDSAWLRWREEWLQWRRERGAYAIVEREVMDAIATRWLSSKGVLTTTDTVRNFLLAVKGEAMLPGNVEAPCWIDSRNPMRKPESSEDRRAGGVYVALKNGILDLESLDFEPLDVVTHKPLTAHTPDFFSLNALPYDFDVDAQCPDFLSALNQWQRPLPDADPDNLRHRALQDFAGYMFQPGQGYKTFLLCIGEGDDGKSQIMAIFRALVGDRNCTSVDLSNFDPKDRFGRAPLIGKMLATIADASKIERLAVGILKAITGGDNIGVDRKLKDILDTPIGAKIMVTSNQMPGFNDESNAIWNRLVILNFPTIAEKDREVGFAQRLIRDEMPGIFMWAARGFHRLRAENGFKKVGIIRDNVNEAKTRVQHERAFFDECVKWNFPGRLLGCECARCAESQEWAGDKNAGNVYHWVLRAQYVQFCKRYGYPDYCYSNTLGENLKKWLKERLQADGHAGGAVEAFLSHERFQHRDSKAGMKRMGMYCGIEVLASADDDNASG